MYDSPLNERDYLLYDYVLVYYVYDLSSVYDLVYHVYVQDLQVGWVGSHVIHYH